jgi:predicted GH43/DUF377 family glycosyl hydrolase
LNPAVYQDGDTLHILYRAVQDGNFSTIGYKTDGQLIRRAWEEPLITRDFDYEKQGKTPHRKIEDTYYITYMHLMV